MIWPPGQSVSLVKGAGFVDDSEIVLREEEGPTRLSAGEFLLGAKIGKIIVVGPDFKGKRVAFEVVARDYHGCIRMHPDKFSWIMDKCSWIWIISMDYPHHPYNH